MRCFICDCLLSEDEVVFNKTSGEYEPCTTCLNSALDAAYSDGFNPDTEPLDDLELEDRYGNGIVETIDPDFDSGYGDASDIHYFGGVDD